MKKSVVLIGILVFIVLIISIPVFSEEISVNLTSALHKGINRTEVFVLDGFYEPDMKDSFFLNFTDDLTNDSILKIYARKNKGLTVGIYAQSDINGENPLGTFIITSVSEAWYNITLTNFTEPTNAIWLGEGIGSETSLKEKFYYITAVNIIEAPDLTPPSTITNLVNQPQGLDFIYWTWTNPLEEDFLENIIYLDDVNVLNTSDNFYNATSLSEDTEYIIKIHTIDTNDNINNTDVTSIVRTLKTCVENWSCGEWSECVNETQTRSCSDLNECGTELEKPSEEQECTVEESGGGGSSSGSSGGSSGNSGSKGIGIIDTESYQKATMPVKVGNIGTKEPAKKESSGNLITGEVVNIRRHINYRPHVNTLFGILLILSSITCYKSFKKK